MLLQRRIKMPAPNVRFGVMAAVAPQTRQCKFAREYPAASLVGAATTPSRWDVGCKRRKRGRNDNKMDNATKFECIRCNCIIYK